MTDQVSRQAVLDVMEALVAAAARKASNTKLEPVEWAYGDVLIVTDEAIKTLRALPPATSAGEVWQDLVTAPKDGTSSEESRVGKGCVSTCRSRWSSLQSKKNRK